MDIIQKRIYKSDKMPVTIKQGENTVLAAPGVVVGISEESNAKTMDAQKKHFEEANDQVTLSLFEKAKKKLSELEDLLKI